MRTPHLQGRRGNTESGPSNRILKFSAAPHNAGVNAARALPPPFVRRGQRYEALRVEPYVTKQGFVSQLFTLRTNCKKCDAPCEVNAGPMALADANQYLTRHCPDCRTQRCPTCRRLLKVRK